jgi:hypothetical protein
LNFDLSPQAGRGKKNSDPGRKTSWDYSTARWR